MEPNNSEKKYSGSDLEATVGPANKAYTSQAIGADQYDDFYDPSLESKWTRAGLTLESFKRAPGSTR
jgi:amino acid transporter